MSQHVAPIARRSGAGRHRHADQIVAAVRACVGARFRPQGRRADTGLDCIGVALIAARAAGLHLSVPLYRMGGDHEVLVDYVVGQLGLMAIDAASPGDICIFAPAPGLRHVAVQTGPATNSGHAPVLVHAHAGVGRVVETTADPAWALVGHWRLPERI